MITTYDVKFIDGDALKDWLTKSLEPFGFKDKLISFIPHPWEAKGESRFFCEIEVEKDISMEELVSQEVKEHSRGSYVHFYVADVVRAAVSAKMLQGDHFYLYYRY